MQPILQSQSDGREYECFALSNGLRVVVAQDPDTSSQAAAALTVQVGSIHEPKEIPGLAHFCEHMVLHGTFSSAVHDPPFSAYVKQHGGNHNGVTTMQQTCFAFEVRPERLEGALSRFSHFFSAPRFSQGNMEQEIKAVDSEHSMNLQNDFRRQWAILLQDANPRHPYHWGSGCRRSLQKCPFLFEALRDFHSQNYLAERMTLAVVSTQPTPMIAHFVKRYFATAGQGPSRSGKRKPGGDNGVPIGDEVGGAEPPFLPEDFQGQVYMVPVKDIRQLRLSWLLPWQQQRWRNKPTTYVTYLLGHEGQGGLVSALKSRGLATGVTAACFDYHGCASTFEVAVDLTENGNQESVFLEVGRLIFAFIGLLREAGPQPWIFEEQRRLQELDFHYHYDTTAYNLAQDLSCNLHYYPRESLLAGDHLLFDFDPAAIKEVLRTLSVASARLWLVAREFERRCTSQEPWYGSKFVKQRGIDAKLLREWRAVEAESWRYIASSQNLQLPSPNRFLPKDFCVLPADPTADHIKHLPMEPRWCCAWYRQGGSQHQPKAAVSVYFHCPFTASGSTEAALTHMFCHCVQEELREECAYEARAAGVMYKLEQSETGLVLQFLGFSDRLSMLAAAVARKMAAMQEVPETTWAVVHDEQERLLSNSAQRSAPYSQAMVALEELTLAPRWSAASFHSAIQGMRRTDLLDIGSKLFSRCLVEALLVGNLTETSARDLLHAVLDPLRINQRGHVPTDVPVRSEACLPRSVPLTMLTFDGTNPEDPNNCAVVSLCNIVETTPENEAMMTIVARVLKPLFFNEMRTKQQLGYVVSSFLRARIGYISFIFLVQTERPPEIAKRAIESFLEDGWKAVQNLPRTEFQDHCSAAVRLLKEAPRNLWESMQRDWLPLEERTWQFDGRERQIRFLQTYPLDKIQRLVQDHVRSAPRLCVLVRSRQSGGSLPPAGAERTARRVFRGKGVKEFRDSLQHKEINTVFKPGPRPPSGTVVTKVVLPEACSPVSYSGSVAARRAQAARVTAAASTASPAPAAVNESVSLESNEEGVAVEEEEGSELPSVADLLAQLDAEDAGEAESAVHGEELEPKRNSSEQQNDTAASASSASTGEGDPFFDFDALDNCAA